MKTSILAFFAATAALAATVPAGSTLFRRDCPELSTHALEEGCSVWSQAECEICCPSNVQPDHCHAGHDANPCSNGWAQWHCDDHTRRSD